MSSFLTQSLVGTAFLWGVPLSEDRGGSWNSSQRDARQKGESRWTNMASGRGQYDVTTIDNSKEVAWGFVSTDDRNPSPGAFGWSPQRFDGSPAASQAAR